jgi:hypothetical protein
MRSNRSAPTLSLQSRVRVGCVARSGKAPALTGVAVGALARFVNHGYAGNGARLKNWIASAASTSATPSRSAAMAG